jgi:hypothetical protein
VADCALLDQVLAAEADGVPAPRGLRFAASTVFEVDLSPAVADAFKAALRSLVGRRRDRRRASNG